MPTATATARHGPQSVVLQLLLQIHLAAIAGAAFTCNHTAVDVAVAQAPCLRDQEAALLRLKRSFTATADSVAGFRSWKVGTDCCRWAGVRCGETDGLVNSLDLGSWGLESSGLHPALFDLTNLRWRGRWESPPRRSRGGHGGRAQGSNLVWRKKEHKEAKKNKRVTFADPIATELKPRKKAVPDDSVEFIKEIVVDSISDLQQSGGTLNIQTSDNNNHMSRETETNFMINNGKKTEQIVQDIDNKWQAALADLQGSLHFEQPMEKSKMEAILNLIEQEIKKGKKGLKKNLKVAPDLAV